MLLYVVLIVGIVEFSSAPARIKKEPETNNGDHCTISNVFWSDKKETMCCAHSPFYSFDEETNQFQVTVKKLDDLDSHECKEEPETNNGDHCTISNVFWSDKKETMCCAHSPLYSFDEETNQFQVTVKKLDDLDSHECKEEPETNNGDHCTISNVFWSDKKETMCCAHSPLYSFDEETNQFQVTVKKLDDLDSHECKEEPETNNGDHCTISNVFWSDKKETMCCAHSPLYSFDEETNQFQVTVKKLDDLDSHECKEEPETNNGDHCTISNVFWSDKKETMCCAHSPLYSFDEETNQFQVTVKKLDDLDSHECKEEPETNNGDHCTISNVFWSDKKETMCCAHSPLYSFDEETNQFQVTVKKLDDLDSHECKEEPETNNGDHCTISNVFWSDKKETMCCAHSPLYSFDEETNQFQVTVKKLDDLDSHECKEEPETNNGDHCTISNVFWSDKKETMCCAHSPLYSFDEETNQFQVTVKKLDDLDSHEWVVPMLAQLLKMFGLNTTGIGFEDEDEILSNRHHTRNHCVRVPLSL